jgi:hypothetical protein
MEQSHRYFFGNHPQMPWKNDADYWGLIAKEGVEGWEPGERRFVLMEEYQRLIRKYPNNWIYEGIKDVTSEIEKPIQEDVHSGKRRKDF